MEKYARLYLKDILRLHGIPSSNILYKGEKFTSRYSRPFKKGLGNQLKLSTAFHPHKDGQAERTIQTLEYFLIACVIDFKGRWDDHLPLNEFSYNNSYHSSICMIPSEELYGRICRCLFV